MKSTRVNTCKALGKTSIRVLLTWSVAQLSSLSRVGATWAAHSQACSPQGAEQTGVCSPHARWQDSRADLREEGGKELATSRPVAV